MSVQLSVYLFDYLALFYTTLCMYVPYVCALCVFSFMFVSQNFDFLYSIPTIMYVCAKCFYLYIVCCMYVVSYVCYLCFYNLII